MKRHLRKSTNATGKNDYIPTEPSLFSEDEMGEVANNDFFDQYAEAYLEAMRIVCRLDDMELFNLSQEYHQCHDTKEAYYLHVLPSHVMTLMQFMALGDCINMRRGYMNNPSQKPHMAVPESFVEARKRFMEEIHNGKYGHTDWIFLNDYPQGL